MNHLIATTVLEASLRTTLLMGQHFLLFSLQHLALPWRVSNKRNSSDTAFLTMQHVNSTKFFAELNPMISTGLTQTWRFSGSCLKCEGPSKTDSRSIYSWDSWRWNKKWRKLNRWTQLSESNPTEGTVTYIQEQSLQGGWCIQERNQIKIIVGWGKCLSPNLNSRVLEVDEFCRQHWCISHKHNKYMSCSD
jgi:hypothetical protein